MVRTLQRLTDEGETPLTEKEDRMAREELKGTWTLPKRIAVKDTDIVETQTWPWESTVTIPTPQDFIWKIDKDIAKTEATLPTPPAITTPEIPESKIEEPEIIPPVTTPTIPEPEVTEPTKPWIPELEPEIAKLREEKEKAIDDTFQSYILSQAEFERNKDFYTNFWDVNETFKNVIDDTRALFWESWTWQITEEQYQQIADKYWITVDEVKNPLEIMWKLELTEEWKKEIWADRAQDKIDQFQIDFERKQEDLKRNTDITLRKVNQQIEDVERNLQRNIDVMVATWVWAWAERWSWFTQWLQNVKDDWERTISRLKEMAEDIKTSEWIQLSRLQEDFDKWYEQAKQDLDDQLQNIKFESWLELSGKVEEFWIWNPALTKELDKIQWEFSDKSMKAFNDYVTNLKAIQSITNTNLERVEKLKNVETKKIDTRYNQFLANNWALLQNTGLVSLWKEVEKWTLSLERFNDLKNIMSSSINSTLSKRWTVTPADLNVIDRMLEEWKTPSQIVAFMQKMEKFETTEWKPTDWIKISENRMWNRRTGEEKIFKPIVPTPTEWVEWDWIIWALWVPVSYERRIKQMVPATLMNSEIELEQLNETIKAMHKAWLPANEAVLTFLWVDLKEKNKEIWLNIIDTARLLEDLPSNYYTKVTDFVNKWNVEGAIRFTENLAIKEAQKINPDLKFSEWGTTFAVKQANDLLNLMEDYENRFWPLKWKWSNLTKWVFWDKEAQKLATKITQSISKMRNDLVWANITGWEIKAINDLIPKLDETAETARVKVKNIKETPLLRYNQARKSIWLPEITEDQLLNFEKRVDLYQPWKVEAPKATLTERIKWVFWIPETTTTWRWKNQTENIKPNRRWKK